MNKSYRIRTEVGTNADKNIKLKLDQEFDSFEILSLKIDQKDVYQNFNCDYGVLIGRVNANGGVGIPNAKVSIFIPITDEDSLRPEIKAIYPYESPRDKNVEGKRYNLLPRVAEVQLDGTVRPKQPFGTLPTKPEMVTNDSWLEVYETYYKYSTVTNDSGDYMLFGVPTGTQTVHMSVDITDIGRFSMTPATMVTNLGYSENLFTDNGTKVKPSNDLDDLPNIETQEISVDVIPFCGDDENFDIGITRQDFRIRAKLISTFIVFGTAFTNGDNETYGEDDPSVGANIRLIELYRASDPSQNPPSLNSNRIEEVTEQIFYYPATVSDEDIDLKNVNPDEDIYLLDSAEYGSFKRNGDFVFIIPCNRDKIITDEFGNDVPVGSDSVNGVFTTFKGFMTLEISEDTLPLDFTNYIQSGGEKRVTPIRQRLKFPQSTENLGERFNSTDDENTLNWKRDYKKFEFGNIYGISHFYGVVTNDLDSGSPNPVNNGQDFWTYDKINDLRPILGRGENFNTVGIVSDCSDKDFPSNKPASNIFGANWMNFCAYFLQNGRLLGQFNGVKDIRTNSNWVGGNDGKSTFYMDDNIQTIAGGIVNTKWFARNDLHYTDFILVPPEDLVLFNNDPNNKGFVASDFPDIKGTEYKYAGNGVPTNGGKLNGDPTAGIDGEIYFYKGLNESNVIKYLFDLGLV